jgi:RNA polymerase sigma factor (sigma-70 family)
MKSYNLANYIKYKRDLKNCLPKKKAWKDYTRNELIITLIPFAETIARSFSVSDKASGIMNIMDIMQEANIGLILALDRLDWTVMNSQDEYERQIKGFIKKRINGAVRRAVDTNRGGIRIPEHKLNELRKQSGEDRKIVQMFFNSVFKNIDETKDVEDKSKEYNINILNKYILSLMKTHLNDKEYDVVRMSFGLDCDKLPAKKIAALLNIVGSSDFVRVSQIKKEAIEKLINTVDSDFIIDFIN